MIRSSARTCLRISFVFLLIALLAFCIADYIGFSRVYIGPIPAGSIEQFHAAIDRQKRWMECLIPLFLGFGATGVTFFIAAIVDYFISKLKRSLHSD